MNDYSAVAAYQQSAARGATPVGMVVSLYDTILRDLRRAMAALDAGKVEERVFELNHALTVIAHLQSVLDHQRGGEAAARLARFYDITHGMIVEANAGGSRTTIAKLVDLYSSLRQAWQQAETQLAAAAAGGAAEIAPPSLQTPAPSGPALQNAGSKSNVPGAGRTIPVATPETSAPRGRWSA